ncbi:MAG: hypothetical protein HC802_20280 [Caldilineaceae bacterium]|nr:hypothetical protein [Caldilineaceae bacterium]
MSYSDYLAPTTLHEALAFKAEWGDRARVVAGGTDLLVELDRGQRRTADGQPPALIDLTRVPGLGQIEQINGQIRLGALVTHNQCAASPLIVGKAFPLARACWEVGAPQIRNRATVAGNLITASPANDTIAPLLALGAAVTVQSLARGVRTLPLQRFITGFRTVDLASDEIVTHISFAPLGASQRGSFIKLGLRRAQAISVINVAVIIGRTNGERETPVETAAIALGAVAPTVVRATAAEAQLVGKPLTDENIRATAKLAQSAASPIDDVRGSSEVSAGHGRDAGRPVIGLAPRWTRAGRLAASTGDLAGRHQGSVAGARPSQRRSARHSKRRGCVARTGHDAAQQSAFGWIYRRQGRLRRGRMWRLHRLSGWHGGDGLSCSVRTRRRQRSGNHRRAGRPAPVASNPDGACAERRHSVWLLHAGICDGRGQAAGRTPAANAI